MTCKKNDVIFITDTNKGVNMRYTDVPPTCDVCTEFVLKDDNFNTYTYEQYFEYPFEDHNPKNFITEGYFCSKECFCKVNNISVEDYTKWEDETQQTFWRA